MASFIRLHCRKMPHYQAVDENVPPTDFTEQDALGGGVEEGDDLEGELVGASKDAYQEWLAAPAAAVQRMQRLREKNQIPYETPHSI